MDLHTSNAIKTVSRRAAERVNAIYESAYDDVQENAGVMTSKRVNDIAAVITEEVNKVFMVAMLSRKNENQKSHRGPRQR